MIRIKKKMTECAVGFIMILKRTFPDTVMVGSHDRRSLQLSEKCADITVLVDWA